MQLPILVGLIFAAGVVALANESVSKGGEKMKESSIAKVLPEGYATYEKALAQGNGTNDARASLELLAKAKESLRQSPKITGADQDRIAAYRATWCLCLRAMKESKDETAQRLILDKWNENLAEDDDAVASQVYALSEQWDRRLLTDDFWKTLQQTNNKKMVSAIGYSLYQQGNQDDLDRMVKIEKQTPGRGLPNAISWLRYRLSGDKTNPGPAAAPPRME